MRKGIQVSTQQPERIDAVPDPRLATVIHPDEIVNHPSMSEAEKRAALASWASDTHAVEGVPALRQLDSGAIVRVDDILQALRRLDAAKDGVESAGLRPPAARPRRGSPLASRMRAYLVPSRRRHDDDDPPPCAAALALPRRPTLVAAGR